MSLLDTSGEVLLPTPINTSHNSRFVVTDYTPLQEDVVVMDFRSVLRDLQSLVTCIQNEIMFSNFKRGCVDDFVVSTIPRLRDKLKSLYKHSVVHDIDRELSDAGFMVTLDRSEETSEKKHILYLTQYHHLTF